jgi:Protein of unknown function (DUF3179)
MTTQRPGWRFILLWLLAGAVSWALLIYPIYVIWPFRYQGPRELLIALAVLRYRPIGMIVAVAGMLAAVVWYWRLERRKVRRFFSAVCVLSVAAAAVLSRINIYEMMFHPAGKPAIVDASESKLDGKEMVIAVKVNGSARAYPIRSMSYHHIYNDVVAGEPIVATY